MFETLTIPLSILLIPYGLFLLVFFIYSIFNVYHLMRFGVYGQTLFVVVVVFLMGSVILSSLTIFGLLQYDWSAAISSASISGDSAIF